jgi:hypothetical protein
MKRNGFFASHSKSSAALVSLGIHAVLLVVALSFVAVSVIQKEEKVFEAKQVNRPKMNLKKLQVPVNIKKKKMQKPKLRKRIVVQPKMNQTMPDIKMPEISGVKGGLGGGMAGGLGGAGGVGFSMPEIEVFGIKGKGEKVFLALDADAFMMRDEVGGMRAYTLIKEELKKIINGLPPTALFNLAVFDHHSTTTLFPGMVSASRSNVARIEQWLDPLNKVATGMADNAYGTKTIGPGGTVCHDDFEGGELQPVEWANSARHWYTPAALAMREQADTAFILTGWWGVQRDPKGEAPEWKASNRAKFEECVRKGTEMLAEENAERKAKGEPPRVIRDTMMIVSTYFPDICYSISPPMPEYYHYTGRDFAKSLHLLRKENAPKAALKSGLSKRKKDSFSVNVIFFARIDDADAQSGEIEQFRSFAKGCNGQFRSIAGFDAIQSSASGE